MYMRVSIGGGGEAMFDEKFVYVNIVMMSDLFIFIFFLFDLIFNFLFVCLFVVVVLLLL